MFYSLLRPINDGDHFPQSSVNVPHYEDSDIPELPACYAEGLRWILHNLVLDNPSQRISERKAMLWLVWIKLFFIYLHDSTYISIVESFEICKLLDINIKISGIYNYRV